ncbi:hypothetical protein [Blastopirellula marina]|uniref:Uncharacterized protein n=1 Tax=Blastopirellula marina TaxID=124 RepID=A0A2S8GC19_9BACT|nr:hypothetical protein [Blastopirellula marina]PQO42006.1 hypothetical protein C5Y93_26980 [Blastopirellula marina]
MNENAQDPNVLHLSKFGLTCFLATVVILPIGMLTFLWVSLPKASDRPLPVEIRLAKESGQMMLVVKNDSDSELSNIGITLNDWFNFYSADPLSGGKELRVSLSSFMRKNGLPFDPAIHQLMEIGVYAQLEDNSRGVWERKSEHLLEDLQEEAKLGAAPQT